MTLTCHRVELGASVVLSYVTCVGKMKHSCLTEERAGESRRRYFKSDCGHVADRDFYPWVDMDRPWSARRCYEPQIWAPV